LAEGSDAGDQANGEEVPNSQKETTTVASAPWKRAFNLARYMGHDEPGEPGRGRSAEDEGDLLMVMRLKRVAQSHEHIADRIAGRCGSEGGVLRRAQCMPRINTRGSEQ
jgi:hypothetical protein